MADTQQSQSRFVGFGFYQVHIDSFILCGKRRLPFPKTGQDAQLVFVYQAFFYHANARAKCCPK